MSGLPTSEPDFHFWDFVGCALCHLLFVPNDKGPPPVPFWLTECGHVVCNNHLNPDRSCPKCGDQGIELIPLQRDMEPPMADWFRSLPHVIDSIANAVKFQQQSLAALVRHYRNRCLQLSATCDRLRNERRDLRKEVDSLRCENAQLRRYSGTDLDHGQELSTQQNSNGKRPMIGVRDPDKSFKTNSSPRSFTTPVGPLRLTLLPRGPQSLSRQDHGSSVQQTARPVAQRPGSTRFTEQYAYQHEENSQTHIPQASYDLSAPRPDIRPSAVGPDNLMPPPPKPQGGRFKPATPLVSDPNSQGTNALKRTRQHSPGLPDGMRPPPTPQRPFARVSQTPTHRGIDPFLSSNRFLSASTTDTVASQRSKDGSNLAGRQRMAFVPGNDTNLR